MKIIYQSIKILAVALFFCLGPHNCYAQKWPFPFHNPFAKKEDTTKKVIPVVPVVSPVKLYKDVVTKGFITKAGLFTVHKSPSIVLFEIPDSILNRDIMVITRISKTGAQMGTYAGEELDERTIEFEKAPDSTILIRYKLVVNEADSTNNIYKAVQASSIDPIGAILPIKAFGKNSSVVDVTTLMKTVGSFFNTVSSDSPFSRNADAANPRDITIGAINVYPINVELALTKTMTGRGKLIPTGYPVTIETHTSFIALPKVAMQKRVADKRVGYFRNTTYVFGDQQQKSEERDFILRWRLEPKPEDIEKWKKGELVEPKKPIVIYIDPATPKQWQPYLIAGINDWQKAFEKAGFKNAIRGEAWPMNDTTMHMDDARYSMINYFPSTVSNAYGPNVHDPRSGEIIQTHIGWYHNVMSLLHNWYMIQAGAIDPKARKAKFDDELMGQLIRFVSSHEVGHTLGLRHNFGSSSLTPVDSLRSKTYLRKHGHTASIMDYARFNYVAQPEDHLEENDIFPHIGEYDMWAIEWGYKNSGAANEADDNTIVKKWIVSRTAKNPRLWFGNGEEYRFDPANQTEDLGDNAMKASAYGIKNLKRIVPHLAEWSQEENGTGDELKKMFGEVKSQYFVYMGHVLKNLGGVHYVVKAEGERGDVFEPTSIARQKEALAFYNTQLFDTPYWLINERVQNRVTFPLFPNFVSDLQVKILNSLLDAPRLTQMMGNIQQFGNKAYPLNDYLKQIHKYIWKEILPGGSRHEDAYRRMLQKTYFGAMLDLLNPQYDKISETDLPALVKADLLELRAEINRAIPETKDPLMRSHLIDMSAKIKNGLAPKNM